MTHIETHNDNNNKNLYTTKQTHNNRESVDFMPHPLDWQLIDYQNIMQSKHILNLQR